MPLSAVSRCSKQYIADRILRLITKSNLAGCNTGKSAGFAALRISCGEELMSKYLGSDAMQGCGRLI